MNRTNIEYGTHAWNVVSGCSHGADVCAVSANCWARGMAKRFHKDFAPELHIAKLGERMPRTPGARILVSLTGDMFGEWWVGVGGWQSVVDVTIGAACQHPEHQFLFLTKNPVAYAQFNPWPSNAWIGMSLTGAEPPERQAAMWEALERVQGARVRWLSHEPAIKPLAQPIPDWLNWVVIGGWSGGKRKVSKECLWQNVPCALWIKSNLHGQISPLSQELPRC